MTDIKNNFEHNINMLQKRIEASNLIHEQIAYLNSERDLKSAIYHVIERIGTYMTAERAYIFEDIGDCYRNTAEWCAEGISPEIDSLQNVPKSEMNTWTSAFENDTCVVIPNIEDIKESDPYVYDTLARQNIRSVVEAPIKIGERIVGFIGVDNAPDESTKLISESLSILGTFIGTAIRNREETEKLRKSHKSLEKERKSYRDALAKGSEFNFFFDIDEGLLHEEFITAHGVNLIRLLNFSVPARFDDLMAEYVKVCGVEFVNSEMAEFFTCAGVRKAFDSGITNAVVEYYTPGTDIYIRVNCLMSLDDATGHVHASVVASDISEMRRTQKAQTEALRIANEKLNLANAEMNMRIDAILDGISGGLKILDAENNYSYVYISEGAAKLHGYTVPEFMKNFGRSILSNIHPNDIETVSAEAKRQIKENDFFTVKYRILCKDGSVKWVVDRGKLSVDNSDGRKLWYILIQDVTEQELMDKKLEEERRLYRNALTLGSDTFFDIDLTDSRISEEVLLKNGSNFFSNLGLTFPTTYDTLAQRWLSPNRITSDSDDIELIRSREKLMDCCRKGTSIINFEYYVPNESKYRRVLVIVYKFSGHIYASFVIYDTTLSRHEEKQKHSLIESLGMIYSGLYLLSFRHKSYTAFKQSDDIASRLDKSGHLNDFNQIYTEEFVLPEDRKNVTRFLSIENIKEVLSDSDYMSIEFRRINMGWCRITIVASERNEQGEIESVIFASNVIDSTKKAELIQQEALKAAYESANIANSAKTNFLANMSHDIRTPMNAIIGLTAIAGTHMNDRERVADCLSKISVSSKHLLGIINEVLDMSKIESGKMELHEESFSLSDLIDNLLTMSKPEVLAKNHKLSVSVRSIEHENVIGDSQRIQQVFMNLMSNAIKYTPEGGKISLFISEKSTNKPQIGCYEFVFEDNGIGMSEEFLTHVFEPFARARNDARVEKIQGTGLGMPITHNIVQMMNGDIKIQSKLNEGTRVTVTFFLKLKTKDEEAKIQHLADLPILVADDDEISCIYTCEMLAEIGMKGEWVLSGAEAIEKIIEHRRRADDYFAVILDWKMPEMNGIETAREIRRRVGDDVPIIIISAYDWTDIEFEAKAAGASAFISKPLFKSRIVQLFNELTKEDEEVAEVPELNKYAKKQFAGKRALLVEDNELNSEIATEILNMAGFEVESVTNGKEAVDNMSRVENGYYDIIFMDIQMPVMNGYEAARAIRNLPGDYVKSVPILAMTANAFAEDVAAAKNAGMNEHIAKPIDFDQLMKALSKWL